MKKFFIYIITGAIVITGLFGTPSNSMAAECPDPSYSTNDIIWFNPCGSTCDISSVEVQPDDSGLGDMETIKKIYADLTTSPIKANNNKPLNAAQAAGVMGNFKVESGFDPSAIEVTPRADKGHGLAQWTFGRWTNLSNFASDQKKPWDDLQVQLDFLNTELDGPEKAVLKDSEFASSTDPAVTAMRWRIVFERADPNLAHDDKRTAAAAAIYKLFGGVAAACEAGSSVVAGNLVQTAINLALQKPATTGMNQKSDARNTYQEIKEKINPAPAWSDCGGFVATVMISSGIDKNYPKSGVAPNQMPYVKDHPDKYLVIQNPTLEELVPGDILFMDNRTTAHTAIYTGEEKYPMIDASVTQRVPSVRTMESLKWMLDQSDSMLARVRG
jgi:hypothetical protein